MREILQKLSELSRICEELVENHENSEKFTSNLTKTEEILRNLHKIPRKSL